VQDGSADYLPLPTAALHALAGSLWSSCLAPCRPVLARALVVTSLGGHPVVACVLGPRIFAGCTVLTGTVAVLARIAAVVQGLKQILEVLAMSHRPAVVVVPSAAVAAARAAVPDTGLPPCSVAAGAAAAAAAAGVPLAVCAG
jgi:hypothetical protein